MSGVEDDVNLLRNDSCETRQKKSLERFNLAAFSKSRGLIVNYQQFVRRDKSKSSYIRCKNSESE